MAFAKWVKCIRETWTFREVTDTGIMMLYVLPCLSYPRTSVCVWKTLFWNFKREALNFVENCVINLKQCKVFDDDQTIINCQYIKSIFYSFLNIFRNPEKHCRSTENLAGNSYSIFHHFLWVYSIVFSFLSTVENLESIVETPISINTS